MIFISQTGCLLPLLIILNLFFGWIFFKPAVWLLVGAVLILLFVVNSYFIIRMIIKPPQKKGGIIDIEADVVEKED